MFFVQYMLAVLQLYISGLKKTRHPFFEGATSGVAWSGGLIRGYPNYWEAHLISLFFQDMYP